MRRILGRSLRLRALAVSLLSLLLAGCTLLNLREESREFYAATVLSGRVAPAPQTYGPLVVAALTFERGRPRAAHSVWLHEPGGYELIVPDGRYRVVAFGDTNRNGQYDLREPMAILPTEIATHGAGIIMMLDLTLTDDIDRDVAESLAALPSVPLHSTQAGAIADLDNLNFSSEQGREGYWSPLSAFRRTGGNVYFLEPYDPERIPVLFVHGAAGSPQDFRYFFERLDRTRYQAWFFQYPSGAALESMSNLLYWKLMNLQLRYGFARLHIVAHSMGGLVARRFLLDHGSQFAQLGQFITVSTPWGGESAAELGVKHSPGVIPSWRDMQPNGAFMQRLFERELPAHVTHTLLFGHRGGYNLLRPTTDGAVTLASQLRHDAQVQARLVMGFDEDHVGILSAPAVFEQVARVLDGDGVGDSRNAWLRLSLLRTTSALPSDGVAAVLLTPKDAADQAPLVLLVSPAETSVRLGPIPPGEYDAQFATAGIRATPAIQRLEVRAEHTASLSFTLRAQGVLSGYVGADGDAFAYPAGSYRPPHPTIEIQRVVLEGPGGTRTLVARRGADSELLRAYADGRDAAVNAGFHFLELEDGEYRLTLEAKGYEPYTATYRVIAGATSPVSTILLEPLPASSQ